MVQARRKNGHATPSVASVATSSSSKREKKYASVATDIRLQPSETDRPILPRPGVLRLCCSCVCPAAGDYCPERNVIMYNTTNRSLPSTHTIRLHRCSLRCRRYFASSTSWCVEGRVWAATATLRSIARSVIESSVATGEVLISLSLRLI